MVFPNVFLVFVGCLWYLWFSRRFFWFCKNLRENKQKQKHKYPRVGLKPLTTLFFWFSLMIFCYCFFGFLLYVWFSRRLFWFCKNLRENQHNKNNKPISKGGSETFKNFVFWFFLMFSFFIVSLVFFCMFGFLEGFVGFVKTFGKTNTTKKTNPYPRVSLKPLNTLFFFVFPNVCLVFFGFLLYVWFSRRICWFCKNLRENQNNNKKRNHIQGWVWNL